MNIAQKMENVARDLDKKSKGMLKEKNHEILIQKKMADALREEIKRLRGVNTEIEKAKGLMGRKMEKLKNDVANMKNRTEDLEAEIQNLMIEGIQLRIDIESLMFETSYWERLANERNSQIIEKDTTYQVLRAKYMKKKNYFSAIEDGVKDVLDMDTFWLDTENIDNSENGNVMVVEQEIPKEGDLGGGMDP